MTMRANGTFEVKLTPQPQEEKSVDATLGRMLIDKMNIVIADGKHSYEFDYTLADTS